MKIVVCVKHVPDAQGERSFRAEDNTVDRAAADGLLSELDEYAVEEALVIAEANDGEVVALTMGPADAELAIRKSLQMGAHQGVHICDDALHGSDSLATSLVLAKAIEKIGDVQLVLCGMSSTDGVMGVIPAMLAERLGMPQVTFGSSVDVADGQVTVRRDADTATETVTGPLPAVVSVTDQTNDPRYPSFKGIMAAKKRPVDTWSLADLGVDPAEVGLAAAGTTVVAINARPPRSKGEVVTSDGDGGTRLAEFLVAQRFV